MKSYVNKNQYGYDVLGVIIDDDNKTVTKYTPSMMPIGKHKKATKKFINEAIELYVEAGYTLIVK